MVRSWGGEAIHNLITQSPHCLLAQAESADQGQVTAAIGVAKVVQQAVALADHHQQPAAAGVVFLVRAHMLVELVDSSRQQRDLHFGRARVRRFASILIDDLGFAVLRNRHFGPHHPRRLALLPMTS